MNVKDAVPGTQVKSGEGYINNLCFLSLSISRVSVHPTPKAANRVVLGTVCAKWASHTLPLIFKCPYTCQFLTSLTNNSNSHKCRLILCVIYLVFGFMPNAEGTPSQRIAVDRIDPNRTVLYDHWRWD